MSIYSRLLTVGMSPSNGPAAAAAAAAAAPHPPTAPPVASEAPPSSVNSERRSKLQPRGITMPQVSRPSMSPPRLPRGSVSFGSGATENVPLNARGAGSCASAASGVGAGENWERTWVGGSSADIQKLGKQIRSSFKRNGAEGRKELKVREKPLDIVHPRWSFVVPGFWFVVKALRNYITGRKVKPDTKVLFFLVGCFVHFDS